jgi:hypothetical protein
LDPADIRRNDGTGAAVAALLVTRCSDELRHRCVAWFEVHAAAPVAPYLRARTVATLSSAEENRGESERAHSSAIVAIIRYRRASRRWPDF